MSDDATRVAHFGGSVRGDFASLTPAEKVAAEQAQDAVIMEVDNARHNLDFALKLFNVARARIGLEPVSIRIPEETT